MPRYQVTGTMTIAIDVEVDAEDEDAAAEKVEEMDYEDLVSASSKVTIDVDGTTELPEEKTGS